MEWDINNIEDGVYYDMPIDVYHGNKTHLSASSIKESFKSLAHFKHYLNKKQEKKIYFDFGNAFELSITDDKEFVENVAIFDKDNRPEPNKTFASKTNKEWKNKFNIDNANKLIINFDGDESINTIISMKESLYKHPACVAILKNANYQTSIFWTDKETGLKLKTRPDFWKPATKNRTAIITDLKTDVNTEESKHLKKIIDLNYPIQAVMQIRGLKSANLISDCRFFWTVCSKRAPFNTEVYEFDIEDIIKFDDALSFKLNEIKRAMEKDSFLSYDPARDYGIKAVEFPYYYKRKMGITEEIGEQL